MNSESEGALQENQVCQTQIWLEGSKEKLGGDLCISSRLIDAQHNSTSATVYVANDIHLIVDPNCSFPFDYGKDLSLISSCCH